MGKYLLGKKSYGPKVRFGGSWGAAGAEGLFGESEDGRSKNGYVATYDYSFPVGPVILQPEIGFGFFKWSEEVRRYSGNGYYYYYNEDQEKNGLRLSPAASYSIGAFIIRASYDLPMESSINKEFGGLSLAIGAHW